MSHEPIRSRAASQADRFRSTFSPGNYDKSEAAAKLQEIIAESDTGENSRVHQLHVDKVKSASVKRISRPECWKLYEIVNDDPTEIVFRIQGIIQSKELPPVGRNANRSTRARKYLRQQVTLFGFEAPSFQAFVDSMEAMYFKYGDAIAEGSLELWNPPTDDKGIGFDLVNRYFTHISHSGGEPAIPFHESVDPCDVLKQMGGGVYIHTQDNHVDYIERISTGSANAYQYRIISPATFKVGDIVECALVARCYPTGNDTVKLSLTLKALVLIDRSVRDKACILRMRNRIKPKTSTLTLKRPAMYDIDEEVEASEKAMSRMRIE
ncbi:hypothetical protein CC1G_10143 [Coprinopsis cinerea okayama7|uniref:Uncharacterized protein n=1 Tax=Coprinopsis cinerea (strain Okayama-7 / 130 / ATCC MYA-4618 / FGSC 9003) TaxID=240176 RepID=A8PED2_COPC7|nr:hypothetical protein CC1G_10143 [Coprinopsis cinerea okayama7\|eukprot:XP_001840769.2 hypothetical protein CC1G_10143 [Coprinopsis cinerea okayama7\